jgi:OFA family oxalate/formate antiporter-like MFS transporter
MILYFIYGAGGLGVGVLYGVSTASAIKWFPRKRGFATGIIVFGFGAGTALFNWIIQRVLETSGVRTAFLYVGIVMLVILVPLSLVYRYPQNPVHKEKSTVKTDTDENMKPLAMLGTYQWYIIFFSFIATVSIVLIFGAQMKMLAEEFALPRSYFQVVLVLFPLGNGLSRVIAGAISDRIGREKTMVLFFSLLAVAIITFIIFGRIPFLFVLIVFLAALLGGSPFALFPATIGDYYGSRFSATNYGITYTAKAWAGLISGWLSAYLAEKLGSYQYLLAIIAICSLAAAVLCSPKILRPPKTKATRP